MATTISVLPPSGALAQPSAVATETAATVDVVTGASYSCALRTTGAIKCWGDNHRGMLGLGDRDARGDGPAEMGERLAAVHLGTGRSATTMDAGYQHTCAVLDNGQVKCWGSNTFGVLGLGVFGDRGSEGGQMGDRLPAVDLGTDRTATAVALGSSHTCALLDGGDVKCWGIGGVLGLGDDQSRGSQPQDMGEGLPLVDLGAGRTAVALAAGGGHTCDHPSVASRSLDHHRLLTRHDDGRSRQALERRRGEQ